MTSARWTARDGQIAAAEIAQWEAHMGELVEVMEHARSRRRTHLPTDDAASEADPVMSNEFGFASEARASWDAVALAVDGRLRMGRYMTAQLRAIVDAAPQPTLFET